MKNFILIFHALFFLAIGNYALAQTPFTNNLTTCLVRSTSEDDKTILINWILSIVSEHPDVDSVTLSERQKTIIDVKVADLLVQLLVKRCRPEFQEAQKYEGDSSLEASFAVLGEIAMNGLMGDNKVNEASERFLKYVDEDALMELLDY